MDIDILKAHVKKSISWADCMRNLGYKATCQSQIETLRAVFNERKVSTDHFLSRSKILTENAKRKAEQAVSAWLLQKKDFSPIIKGWQMDLKAAIKQWLLDRAGNKCECCGWAQINKHTQKIPLQIHHKDGCADNNRPENLQVLCPNCHSLTENFGRRNVSKRIYRYKPTV